MRDELALERTRLANERTFLAYMRTALALFAGAAAVFKFFNTDPPMTGLAWFLLIGGLASLGIGIARYLKVGKRLNESALRNSAGSDGSP